MKFSRRKPVDEVPKTINTSSGSNNQFMQPDLTVANSLMEKEEDVCSRRQKNEDLAGAPVLTLIYLDRYSVGQSEDSYCVYYCYNSNQDQISLP